MKKPKRIYVWGPDLKPPKNSANYHGVELLREMPKPGEKIDKDWVEFRRVSKRKK